MQRYINYKTYIIIYISAILFLQVLWPINFLFNDDWVFLNWLVRDSGLNINSALSLVNGHNQALVKILVWLLGNISPFRIFYISIFNTILISTGFFLILKSQDKVLGVKNSSLFYIASFSLLLNFKQMQNFSMLVSTGWCAAIFFFGLYFNVKTSNYRYSNLYLIIILSLSPFTIGLGYILPICEIIEKIYLILKCKISPRQLIIQFSTILYCILLIYFARFYQVKQKNFDILATVSDPSTSLGFTDQLFSVITHPFRTISWILTSIGNTFTPSTRFNPNVSLILGLFFVLFLTAILKKNFSEINWEYIYTNKSCFSAGLIYILVLTFERSSGGDPLLYASSPRYVTGSVVFVVGSAYLILNFVIKRKILLNFLVILFFVSSMLGIREGLIYQHLRYEQSNTIIGCYAESQYNLEIGNDKCFQLAFRESYNSNQNEFRNQLKDFFHLTK